MKKYLLLCFITLFVSSQAQAILIQGITGADMAGIEVEVEFADGSSDSGVWFTMSATAGGYINGMWGIRLDGDSHGIIDTSGNILAGMFVLQNSGSVDIMSLTLRALNAGFVFDTEDADLMANGSGSGKSMYSPNPSATVTYSNHYMDELYGTFTIRSTRALAEARSRVAFVTDVDGLAVAQDVPAPAGIVLSILMLGLIPGSQRLSSRYRR